MTETDPRHLRELAIQSIETLDGVDLDTAGERVAEFFRILTEGMKREVGETDGEYRKRVIRMTRLAMEAIMPIEASTS